MTIELTDDEAAAVAETLRRTVRAAEVGATRDHNLVAEQQHVARVGRLLGAVLDRLERPRVRPAFEATTFWIMQSPDGLGAVLVHRPDERQGMLELGYAERWSARLDTHEHARAWFETWSRANLGEAKP